MKIYTGTGDRGKTSLFSGERVSKSGKRIEAYGDVDELNSMIGAVAAALEPGQDALVEEIEQIQSDLFHVGAWLATTPGAPAARSIPPISEERIRSLENAIDRLSDRLDPLTGFILPGGHLSAALAHVARTVCRRAERHAVAMESDGPPVGVLIYLNRLSDYLFTLARYCNRITGRPDILWDR